MSALCTLHAARCTLQPAVLFQFERGPGGHPRLRYASERIGGLFGSTPPPAILTSPQPCIGPVNVEVSRSNGSAPTVDTQR